MGAGGNIVHVLVSGWNAAPSEAVAVAVVAEPPQKSASLVVVDHTAARFLRAAKGGAGRIDHVSVSGSYDAPSPTQLPANCPPPNTMRRLPVQTHPAETRP